LLFWCKIRDVEMESGLDARKIFQNEFLRRCFIDGTIWESKHLKGIIANDILGLFRSQAILRRAESSCLIFLSLVANIEPISISEHLEAYWQLHILDVTQEQLVEVSTSVYRHAHLDFQFGTWLYHSRGGLKLAYDLLRVVFLLPSEVSWEVTVVLEYQSCFLML